MSQCARKDSNPHQPVQKTGRPPWDGRAMVSMLVVRSGIEPERRLYKRRQVDQTVADGTKVY